MSREGTPEHASRASWRRAARRLAAAWSATVPRRYMTSFRVVVFGSTLYLLLSRYYDYLALVPPEYVAAKAGRAWFTKLLWWAPSEGGIVALQALAILACALGALGVLVRQAAVVGSFATLSLLNLQETVAELDYDAVLCAVAMWTLVLVDPRVHGVPWRRARSGPAGPAPPCPAFPFRLLLHVFVALYCANGLIKLPFWREWVLEPGVLVDARNWNEMSPFFASPWPAVRALGLPDGLWQVLGALTILFESTAPLLLWFPRLMLIWWPVLTAMHVGIWVLLDFNFLLAPLLLLVTLLALWPRPARGEARPC